MRYNNLTHLTIEEGFYIHNIAFVISGEVHREDPALKHGSGHHTTGDGEIYKGEFFEGFRHGKGLWVYPEGHTYDGNWEVFI